MDGQADIMMHASPETLHIYPFLFQHLCHAAADIFSRDTGPIGRDTGFLNFQNRPVHLPLLRCEGAGYGPGARDVHTQVSQIRPEIHQYYVSRFHLPVVLIVVKNTGVGPGTDYWGIGGAVGAVFQDNIHGRGFQFIFICSRPGGQHGPLDRLCRNLTV